MTKPNYIFPAVLSYDPGTDKLVPGATFRVYAAADTLYASPLTVMDVFGNTVAGNLLVSNGAGVFPAFGVNETASIVVTDDAHVYVWPMIAIAPETPDGTVASYIANGSSQTVAALTAAGYEPTWADTYGVVGDGTTDDRHVIQLYINTLPAGSVLRLPDNMNCYVSDALRIAKALTIVGGHISMGTGYDAFHVTASNVVFDGVTITGAGTSGTYDGNTRGIMADGTSGAQLSGLQFNNVTITDGAGEGMRLLWCTEFLITNPTVLNHLYAGIMILSGSYGTIVGGDVGNLVQKAPTVNTYGIAMSDDDNTLQARTHDMTLIGVYVHDVPLWEGIDMHGGDKINIVGCRTYNCMVSVAAVVGNSTRVTSPTNITVTGCSFDAAGAANGYGGIRLIGQAGQLSWGTFTSNHIYGHAVPYELTSLDETQAMFANNRPERPTVWKNIVILSGFAAVAGHTPQYSLTYTGGATVVNITGYVSRTTSMATSWGQLPSQCYPSSALIGPMGVSSGTTSTQTVYANTLSTAGVLGFSYETATTGLLGHTISASFIIS